MGTITLVTEEGTQEVQSFSRNCIFNTELTGAITPAVTQSVDFDDKGKMTQITTQCGETENRRGGENKPNLTVEGIITEDQIEEFKKLKFADNVELISDVFNGNITISRLSISQNTDLVYYQENDSAEKQLAFEFQIQTRQPE